jgi:arabinose-5-phosphate isomerase
MNLDKNLLTIARYVINLEAEALKKISEMINKDFEDAVNTILASKGRVVVTGIGKSAIIGNKIVATLNSTGTPSLFMHAADAIHGDLGMIQPEDVVICLSKSGNTPEIKVLTPLLKRAGNKLIALVGNVNSYLAENSDFVLNATVAKEADPNDLAPTTSTTAALALGDALAVCLIEARNFTGEDFARYHPGGSLGKQLYLLVDDVCVKNKIPVVRLDTKLKDVILEMTSLRLGATAVLNTDDSLAGIVTDGDLRRMLNKYDNIAGLTAADIMTTTPKTIEKSEYAVAALNLMQNNNITQLVVTHHGALYGFVHLHDLIKEGIV